MIFSLGNLGRHNTRWSVRFVGAALGGRLTHSEYETSKTYSIVSFRADRKQSQTPQTLSFFQTSNIMAEEPAIAETDAILENAQNKHEVSSIFRKTKLTLWNV